MKVACASLVALVFSLFSFAASNPVPLIYQPLIPTSVAPGHAAFVLTVHGVGFVPGAVIKGNGIALKTKFVNSSTLEAEVPAVAVARPGTGAITVSNPGTGAASNVVYFTVRTPSSTVQMVEDPKGVYGVVGDFNGDHKLDIAVPNFNAGTVDIYLGNGNGTFQPPIHNPAPPEPGAMLVGDFNGDGKLDLAVSGAPSDCTFEETTSVMLGNGDGTLTLAQGAVCGVVQGTADFNGDGKMDLIITGFNGETGSTDVYLGNGDGTFNPNGLTIFANSFNTPVAIGDFNRDGKVDLAFADNDYDGSVGVYLGNGDGSFQPGVLYATQYGGDAAAAADVNGDGILDIVTNGVSVLIGKGDGTFKENGGVFLNLQDFYLAVADVNGDGKLDVWASNGNEGPALLLGDGSGVFQSPLVQLSQGSEEPLTVGDFNGDGKLDLASLGLFLQK